ncbi:HD domain-containing protein [Clostridium tyrobutyricum]|uniref:HD domain-containing protein n=1 Tax=Clostridium tyrobutyricum TaxID=1519 RepID=UPI001C3847FC|nr:HD domain-containing protein [Clostridium tyrobutyricum]MBV4417017.1 HD domain-containing protein [Clostridium tyrobutyricum]MBV4422455.1 HD domain-containing protein [Clostridium tyrobutyricum]
MKKINFILNNKMFKESLKKNRKCEESRKFCHHDLSHMLDTARIAYIISLEDKLNLEKESIYAVALLHDIGRHKQYKENIPHDIASVEIAEEILKECGFENCEIFNIIRAIKNHRNGYIEKDILSQIMYRADKLSRRCFCCNALEECNWSQEKKNYKLMY